MPKRFQRRSRGLHLPPGSCRQKSCLSFSSAQHHPPGPGYTNPAPGQHASQAVAAVLAVAAGTVTNAVAAAVTMNGRCDGDGDGGGGVGGDDGGCGDHSRDDGGTYSLSPLSSLTPLSLLFSLLVCSFLAPLLFFFVCFLALDQHRLLIQVPYDLRLILALLVEKSKPPLHDRHSP